MNCVKLLPLIDFKVLWMHPVVSLYVGTKIICEAVLTYFLRFPKMIYQCLKHSQFKDSDESKLSFLRCCMRDQIKMRKIDYLVNSFQ